MWGPLDESVGMDGWNVMAEGSLARSEHEDATGRFRVELDVRPRSGVKDPQAEAVEESLTGLGYRGVRVHTVGRTLSMTLQGASAEAVRELADAMCRELLVNPNLETYELSVTALDEGRGTAS